MQAQGLEKKSLLLEKRACFLGEINGHELVPRKFQQNMWAE